MSDNQVVCRYLTVNQFCKKYPAFPIGGVRHKIFKAKENGWGSFGVFVRDGSKVLINEKKWFEKLDALADEQSEI